MAVFRTVEQIDRMLHVLSEAYAETNSKSRKKYLLGRIDKYLDQRLEVNGSEGSIQDRVSAKASTR